MLMCNSTYALDFVVHFSEWKYTLFVELNLLYDESVVSANVLSPVIVSSITSHLASF